MSRGAYICFISSGLHSFFRSIAAVACRLQYFARLNQCGIDLQTSRSIDERCNGSTSYRVSQNTIFWNLIKDNFSEKQNNLKINFIFRTDLACLQ